MYKPERSTSSITRLITGNISIDDELEHGSRRTIVDHILNKLESINANIVWAGSVIFCDDPLKIPPL